MFKTLALFSLAAAVSAASAQSIDPAAQPSSDAPAAPIVRAYATSPTMPSPAPQLQPRPRDPRNQASQIIDMHPISGVWLRYDAASSVRTISANQQQGAEVRLDHGRLNVDVHQPAAHASILIDMPGGQTSLLKDGLYTFNADTNTVRVLRGEAAAYPGPINSAANSKPIKIKEDHQFALSPSGGSLKPVEAYPYELSADLLPLGSAGGGEGYADGGDFPPYGYYPYPYYAGFYGYPGFYPGYYGYPFAYGIGFGYGGVRGYYGGGFRGGFRR